MARKLLTSARQHVVNQDGAPEPETTADTVVVGRQKDEDKPAKSSK
jgi:hypothetical protein